VPVCKWGNAAWSGRGASGLGKEDGRAPSRRSSRKLRTLQRHLRAVGTCPSACLEAAIIEGFYWVFYFTLHASVFFVLHFERAPAAPACGELREASATTQAP